MVLAPVAAPFSVRRTPPPEKFPPAVLSGALTWMAPVPVGDSPGSLADSVSAPPLVVIGALTKMLLPARADKPMPAYVMLTGSVKVTSPPFASSVTLLAAASMVAGVMVPPLLATTTLVGSSSQSPATPRGASVLTKPPATSVPALEVSTVPPLPPRLPPRAVIRPSNAVFLLDQTATLPPLPCLLYTSAAADDL